MLANDQMIIAALIKHPTINEAAKSIGITGRTIYSRLANPEFKQMYESAKVEVLNGVTNKLQNNMGDAVDVMVKLMNDEAAPAQVRLNAAKTVLEQGDKYTEASDFMRRIEELESMISERSSNVSPIC